jgi:alpha-L-rhamnosidase
MGLAHCGKIDGESEARRLHFFCYRKIGAMQKKYLLLLLVSSILGLGSASAQRNSVSPRWLHGFWTAQWIACPGAPGNDFGVYHFRKTFSIQAIPASFLVHVSADNRYRLFVNGKSVATGPARSDLANWNFETIDLAPYLRSGRNLVAATVWNFAEYRPYSQISFQTAFLLQGDSSYEEILNSDKTWKVLADSAYAPLPLDREELQTYIVTAEGERVNGNRYAWGFEDPDYDDSGWAQAASLWYPAKSRSFGTDGNWMLVPREIPMPEETPQRFGAVRSSDMDGS